MAPEDSATYLCTKDVIKMAVEIPRILTALRVFNTESRCFEATLWIKLQTMEERWSFSPESTILSHSVWEDRTLDILPGLLHNYLAYSIHCYSFEDFGFRVMVDFTHNMIMFYFHLTYCHISDSALFSYFVPWHSLHLHRRSLDTFCHISLPEAAPTRLKIIGRNVPGSSNSVNDWWLKTCRLPYYVLP